MDRESGKEKGEGVPHPVYSGVATNTNSQWKLRTKRQRPEEAIEGIEELQPRNGILESKQKPRELKDLNALESLQ